MHPTAFCLPDILPLNLPNPPSPSQSHVQRLAAHSPGYVGQIRHALARCAVPMLLFVQALLPTPSIAASTTSAAASASSQVTTTHCHNPTLNLIVLGSGGPELNDQRASTGYLLREGERARILIDFGAGSASTFEKVRAQISDLKAVLLSHLHVDHTNDLPALVKASFFSNRTHDLPILGPSGNDVVPDTTTFIQRLFGERGAWSYLSDFLTGDARFQLRPQTINAQLPKGIPERTFEPFTTTIDGYTLRAIGVSHGLMPSLAWRIEKDGCSVVISGDTSNIGHTLDPLVRGADLFIAHNAVPEKTRDPVALRLHMPPSEIGRIAAQGQPHTLVLSHFMQRSRFVQRQTRAYIQQHYNGPILFSLDGDRYDLSTGKRTPMSKLDISPDKQR